MEVDAKLNYLNIAPRKVRLVADLIRGKELEIARKQLKFCNKKAATPILKLLNQGAANAENNFNLNPLNLYIREIKVDEGPMLKRWKPRAMGRADEIHKKRSHVTLRLEELDQKKAKKKAKKKKKRTKDKKSKKGVKERKKQTSKRGKRSDVKGNVKKTKDQFFRRKSI